jgi:DNA-binding NarL/FixJ family response regulator
MLTRREREVADMLAHDRTTTEIAERLVISPRTVESHVASIVRKLGVADRREAGRVLREAQNSVVSTDGNERAELYARVASELELG